jgi:hypothetical protein
VNVASAAGSSAAKSSSDPFESISNFFSSSVWGVAQFLIQVFVFLLWISLIWWTYQDARRRTHSQGFIWGAVALSTLIPFLGTVIYLVLRPPEYLDDARERELELIALESRIGASGDEESQRLMGRIMEREGVSGGKPGIQNALREAGAATREDIRDLDLRLTELEFRLRKERSPEGAARTRVEPGTRPSARSVEAGEGGDTGRGMIRRIRRSVNPDPEARID